MRLRLGRPDLRRYSDRFAVPRDVTGTPLSVTFLGVSTLFVDDGYEGVLTDGFFSRPGLAKVGLGRIEPDLERIDDALGRAGIGRLAAVLPVHTHFDHALDSAVVADRTGAVLAGGRSALQVGAGHGLPADRLVEVADGSVVTFGAYTATFVASRHCPPDRYPGEITAPVRPPVKASAYRCGEAWSILLAHGPSGRRMLVQGSAGFVPGALAGHEADVAYLGVGQLGLRPGDEIAQYWAETVRAVGARRVVLIHWDDFFRPLDRRLRALPYAGDDLDATMRVLIPLADADGVDLTFPTVWEREDPWA